MLTAWAVSDAAFLVNGDDFPQPRDQALLERCFQLRSGHRRFPKMDHDAAGLAIYRSTSRGGMSGPASAASSAICSISCSFQSGDNVTLAKPSAVRIT